MRTARTVRAGRNGDAEAARRLELERLPVGHAKRRPNDVHESVPEPGNAECGDDEDGNDEDYQPTPGGVAYRMDEWIVVYVSSHRLDTGWGQPKAPGMLC